MDSVSAIKTYYYYCYTCISHIKKAHSNRLHVPRLHYHDVPLLLYNLKVKFSHHKNNSSG